ncbi:hypothetical protein [Halovenus halobia]|uniref:hypothetical protein n=1 Tax=Halovenus halobia TaxID=3396622 RepID=UPI003F543241
MSRTQYVPSEKDMEKKVDEFVTRGYKIKQQGRRSTRLKEKDLGEAPVHGFLFLFALIGSAILLGEANAPSGSAFVIAIIANLIYATYSWSSAEEVIIKVEKQSSGQNPGTNRKQTQSQQSTNQSEETHHQASQQNVSSNDVGQQSHREGAKQTSSKE